MCVTHINTHIDIPHFSAHTQNTSFYCTSQNVAFLLQIEGKTPPTSK